MKANQSTPAPVHNISLRIREFMIPPVRDGLVLGRKSPIGSVAMRKALSLLHAAAFDHIKVKDDVISDILIRSNILRRVPRAKLIQLILRSVKPLMGADEITYLDIQAEVIVEEQL